MLFNSVNFLVFFPIVVLLYFIMPKKLRRLWLLISSYFFYMCWNASYALLIATSTLITWGSGIFIARSEDVRGKKIAVALSVVTNLSILFFFKYFNFLFDNINVILNQFNISTIQNPFSLLLPVGISFYTFQALGYTIDVYRGKIDVEKNILNYALFVSFFPQLVAGPIERSGQLLNQIRNAEKIKVWDYERVVSGLILMMWGLFQKMVIADRLAIITTEVFDHIYAYGTIELIAGAVGFALQIYCDFGGYSIIAIGAAKVMGFSLSENFNTPYLAVSISDFWHRWHITLSKWLRDYLYITLGGNRCPKWRKYCNIMITFLCSGLWHGASWTFVIWGGLHGLYQIVGDLLKPLRKKILDILRIQTDVFSYRLGQIIITFSLTTFAWIFFKAASVKDAFYYVERLFTKWDPWVLFDQSLFNMGLDQVEVRILVIALTLLVLFDWLKYKKDILISHFLMKQNMWFRWSVIILIIVSIIVFGEYGINFDSTQFIYFDF